MPIAYPIWFAGSIFALAGIVGLLLTHFGIVAGFYVISPLLFAAAVSLYAFAVGLKQPLAIIGVFLAASIFFELIVYFDWLGLGGVI
jgi:hypothetical protein